MRNRTRKQMIRCLEICIFNSYASWVHTHRKTFTNIWADKKYLPVNICDAIRFNIAACMVNENAAINRNNDTVSRWAQHEFIWYKAWAHGKHIVNLRTK